VPARAATPVDLARLSKAEATRIALDQPKVASWLSRYPPDPTTSATFRPDPRTWIVRAWSGDAGQIALVTVEDTSGRVSEAWTGPQVAWKMARGREGAFGGKTLNAWYVWAGLCVVFFLGLADLRRPLSLRNLDCLRRSLLRLVCYLQPGGDLPERAARLSPAALSHRARRLGGLPSARCRRGRSGRCGLCGDSSFLIGFRIGLNVETPRGVIDVGYAGVIGASRIADGQAPYGHMPIRGDLEACGPKDADGDVRDRIQTNGRCESANDHGDTYGPVSYWSYVPAYLAFGWSGEWDSLPAAHATSIAFDLLTVLGLVLVGLRFGGSRLAAALAFAWAAYPFTAYALNANTNDTIMPAFLVWGFWLATSPVARGASIALAGWAKFGALLLAPLWASYPTVRLRTVVHFAAAFAATTVAAFALLLLEPSLWGAVETFWERTIGFQLGRDSPFSLWEWGQYHAQGIPDLGFVQPVLGVAAVALAVLVAVYPRRKGPVELAALTATVLMAFQLSLSHWFYLYLPWFFPSSRSGCSCPASRSTPGLDL
jgi:hypothetical protein